MNLTGASLCSAVLVWAALPVLAEAPAQAPAQPESGAEAPAGTPAAIPSTPRIVQAGAGEFLVFDDDRPTVSWLTKAAESVDRTGRFLLGEPSDAPRDKILVLLGKGAEYARMPACRLEPAGRGHWNLALRWNAETRQDDVWLGLAHAWLVQYAIDRKGPDAARFVPLWMAGAIASHARLGLDPNHRTQLDARTPAKPLPLARLVTAAPGTPDAAMAVIQGHVLMEILRGTQRKGPGDRKAGLRDLCTSAHPLYDLSLWDPKSVANEQDLELWWQGAYAAFTLPPAMATETPEQSRTTLSRLITFDLAEGNIDIKATIPEVWTNLGSPGVGELVVQRLDTIKATLPRINPLYHNALVSYGRMLEAMLRNDAKTADAMGAQLKQDLADAEFLEAEVDRLLGPETQPVDVPTAPASASASR